MSEDKSQKKEKKASFANGIINLVGLCFGLVFLVIFIFCIIILLSEYKDDLSVYYSKVGIIFGVFLLAYLGISVLVAKRIKKMIDPLDQIAYGLMENKVKVYGDSDDFASLADGLKKEMMKMEKISSELEETKDNLSQVAAENEKTQLETTKAAISSLETFHSLQVDAETLTKDQIRAKELVDDVKLVEEKLRTSRKGMFGVVKSMDASIKDTLKKSEESKDDLKRVSEAEETMNLMLSESIELIENLYNELSYMQDMMNKLTLFSSNSSLELARSGAFGIGTASAIDDMKELTAQISSKNDEAALLSIRVKNSIKLAKEQATLCNEKIDEGIKSLENNEETLAVLQSQIDMSRSGYEASAHGIGMIMEKVFDLRDLFEKEDAVIKDLSEEMTQLENELDQLKNK